MRVSTRPFTIVGFIILSIVMLLLPAQPYAQTWEELLADGVRLYKSEHPDSGIATCTRALELAENEFGHYDSTVGTIAHRIGGLYLGSDGNGAEARKYELMALDIWDSLPGRQLPIEAFTLHNLGIAEKDLGMSSEAEIHLKLAVDLKRQSPFVKPASLANSILALANIWAKGGRVVEAEKLANEAIDIRTQLYGPDGLKTLMARNILGHVYHYQARAREAADIYSHLVKSFYRLGDTSGALTFSINLAAQYNQLGQYARAESTSTFSLAYLSAIQKKSGQKKALALTNLGRSYFYQRNYVAAETCQVMELEIIRELYGQSNNDYIAGMYNLANTYRESRNFSSADSLYRDVIKTSKDAYGENHPMVGHALREQARLYLRRKLPDSALALAGAAFATFSGRFYTDIALLNEAAALSYSSYMRHSAEVYISSLLALKSPGSTVLDQAANIMFSVKGSVSDEIIARDRFMQDCADPKIRDLFETYQKARKDAARHTAIYGQSDSLHVLADSLSERVVELERKLVSASGRFREYSHPKLVSADEVARCLPPNSILVEYMLLGRFDDSDITQGGHYVYLTITSDGVRSIHDLGSVDKIESLVESYRNHLRRIESLEHYPTSSHMAQYDSLAMTLYREIWQPLEIDIGSRKTVLVSPDGVLNLVSFAGLKNLRGRYLIEDLTIQYLSAGRDLLRPSKPGKVDSYLLAVGDPAYDASVADRVVQLKRAGFASVVNKTANSHSRGIGAPSRSVGDLHMDRLDGSQNEIEQILSDSTLFATTAVLTGISATEDEFKRLAPSATTIHLATHGFYLRSDYTESDNEPDPLEMFGRPTNPLMESGLFFAGGNLHGQGADSAGLDDGILFAEEVIMMDLRKADLVILSACETGLGELQQGEGVFGLRKAFRVAGAKAVVSALWSVPDQQTAELMAELYKATDDNIADRIRTAQLTIIERMRRVGDPTHPYLWAGFTSVGGWR